MPRKKGPRAAVRGRRPKRIRRRGRAAAKLAPAEAVLLDEGVGLLKAGMPRDALAVLERVLVTAPTHADTLNLGGVAAFQAGYGERAAWLLHAAVDADPKHADAHNNLGNVLRAAEGFTEAEASYRRALALDPSNADAHYNLGIALEPQGRIAEAADAYRRAFSLRPGFAEAAFNLGNALKALGLLDDAVSSYEDALVFRPGLADIHNNLGGALQELGRLDAAEAAYRHAVEIAPDHVDAHYNLGVALQEQGRLDDALAAYGRVLEMMPDHAGAHVNMGYALKELGRPDDAIAAYRRAIDAAPDYDKAHANLGDVLLETGDAAAALAVCDEYLRTSPGNTSMLAFKAIVLGEMGDRDGIAVLLGFERLVRPVQCAPPPGHATIAAFNDALAGHVLAHPTLVTSPASHATRGGKHSGELLVEPKGPMDGFEQVIHRAVEEYLDTVPRDPPHPFLTVSPSQLGLSAWAVVMEGQGHQVAHIHPSAWLSGVYYVRVPEIVADPAGEGAGWIEFGRPPEDFHVSAEPEVHMIQPTEGTMILFPSYLYHRTIPFASDETRISIAFDVLARD